MNKQKNLLIVYPYIPHYRGAVFSSLSKKLGEERLLVAAGKNKIDPSIKVAECSAFRRFNTRSITFIGLSFQFDLFKLVLSKEYSCIIFLADPHIVSTWLYTIIAKLRGKKVLFWTHGWLRAEVGVKGLLRSFYYRMADGLLLYGDRAKRIGIEKGFSSDRMTVVYNSLDLLLQNTVLQRLKGADTDLLKYLPSSVVQSEIYFSCVARLNSACQFNLAIEALAILKSKEGLNIPLVLIGEGPEKAKLKSLAARCGVSLVLLGESYSEDLIGAVVFNSRAVVSPGKVGLTAMHSLAYGVPVITHDDYDNQMPEYEAIKPGVTGDFFRKGDSHDLAQCLLRWFVKERTEAERAACIEIIRDRYNPDYQADLIATIAFDEEVSE